MGPYDRNQKQIRDSLVCQSMLQLASWATWKLVQTNYSDMEGKTCYLQLIHSLAEDEGQVDLPYATIQLSLIHSLLQLKSNYLS